jgi:hypothetical protein
MVLWFVCLTIAGTFLVFRDPKLDYRILAIGSILPDAVDLMARRGVGPAHSVVVVVGFLFAVMGVTIGRRPLRKRLLALPIGALAHLVLDAVWNNTPVFWWPFGSRLVHGSLPSFDRWPAVALVQEVVGVAVGVWCVRHFQLDRSERRSLFLRHGHLDPSLAGPAGAASC